MYYESFMVKGGFWWMFPIAVFSILGFALALERGWFWFRHYRRANRRREVLRSILNEPFDADRIVARLGRSGDLTLAPHLVLVRSADEVDLDVAEARSRDRADEVVKESRKFLATLQFVTNMSATLGLFGTVGGVALAFQELYKGNSDGLLSSLATAMYTTIAGLLLFFYVYAAVCLFHQLSEGLADRLDREINRFREYLDLSRTRPAADADFEAAP